MSRYTLLNQRPIYQALATIFMGLSASSAYAITVGQATVQSEQHEPLVATIAVNNIDAKHFQASLASSTIYQQMGLEQTAITVQFVPTSDTAGQILLTSNQPISTPFADVILNIDNNGEQHIEPQTLLMPLPKNNTAVTVQPSIITADTEQNLPIVGNHTVLLDESLLQPMDDTSTLAHTPKHSQSSTEKAIKELTPDGTNNQLQILTEQITRRVFPAGTAPSTPTVTETNESLLTKYTPEQPPELEEEFITQDDSTSFETDTDSIAATPDTTYNQDEVATYTVQSGDSLWKIANEIAKANNLGINDVMNDLYAQNPNAFNNNKNRLKANAVLRIANYEVVPSQKAISEAIAARGKKDTKKAARPNTTVAQKSIIKPLPKPQVTLVTPSKTGSATGASREPITSNTQGGGGDLITNLKDTRASTAQTARRINGLNQELHSTTHKLRLQNQRLAELEARLRALKDKP